MNSVGFLVGSTLVGFAKDVEVSTTPIQIPLVGIGLIGSSILTDNASTVSGIRVFLETPILNDLYFDLHNVTTGHTLSGGSLHIASGSLVAYFSSPLTISTNDQVFLTLALGSGNPQIASVSWQTY
jgi:hypothetical protein